MVLDGVTSSILSLFSTFTSGELTSVGVSSVKADSAHANCSQHTMASLRSPSAPGRYLQALRQLAPGALRVVTRQILSVFVDR